MSFTLWKSAGPIVPLHNNCPVVSFTDTGSITFVATRDTRAGTSVWVLHIDKNRSSTTQTVWACGSGATLGAPASRYTILALNIIGEIVLPDDGGTVTLTGSSPGPSLPQEVSLTFTATVTEG